MFIHADLPVFLNIFLLVEMGCCGTWRWSFSITQLSWVSLFSPGPLSNGTLPRRYMESPKSAYLKSRTVILHFALLLSLHNTELSYHGHCRQGCLLPSQSLPFLVSVSRASLLTVFFCHLEQKVVTDVLQDPPALCVPQGGWSVSQVIQDYKCKATSSFEQEAGLGISQV